MPRRSAAYEDRRQRLVASLVDGSTVLDLGYAQDPNRYLGGHRVGLDLNRPEPGRSCYDEEIVGDVTDLAAALDGRRFATVVCAELIEHLEAPYHFLRSLLGAIEPAGQLVLSTPNPVGFPVVLSEWTRDRRHFYTSEHAWYLAPRWVERLLEASGWRVEQVRGVGLWPFARVPATPGLSYQVVYVARPR